MQPSYKDFTSSDFLTDDYFVGHHLYPTPESIDFWGQWLSSNPENLAEWEHALYLLDSLKLGLSEYTKPFLAEQVIDQLLDRIQESNHGSKYHHKTIPLYFKKAYWLTAACLLFAFGISAIWWTFHRPTLYQEHLAAIKPNLIEKVNRSESNMAFTLPDGSTVELSPDSRLAYSKNFIISSSREVFLSGGALFEVTKNPGKPFLVYANSVVTKVLGTRFSVRAYESELDVKVDVKSGQVSVFEEASSKTEKSHQNQGLLLLPNQQAVFFAQTKVFSKTLVEKPTILAGSESKAVRFDYDEAPLDTVFKDIETAYGIPIRFNKDTLKGCRLSASIQDESFEQKLEIICGTMQAQYQILDGQIIVSGGGCK